MAAAQQGAMHTYLCDAIGIRDPVASRQAIQDEGLNLITDFNEFEKEDIETLCSSVQKPGNNSQPRLFNPSHLREETSIRRLHGKDL